MKQNKYDDPQFFARYSHLPRSRGGLDAAGEWFAFRALLPDLGDKRVLDLGCGFGWHCRYAREQHARSVVGVDISENMLARAREFGDDPGIDYRRAAIEDVDFAADEFDVVMSSLALHYIERFDDVCRKIYCWLAAGGAFVFSVEHPIFTAIEVQDWHYGPEGERLHWPVDDYQQEGIRHTRWMADDVVKYHRTFATYIDTLINTGFRIASVLEPVPPPEMLAKEPALRDEHRRPMFLLIAAIRPRAPQATIDS